MSVRALREHPFRFDTHSNGCRNDWRPLRRRHVSRGLPVPQSLVSAGLSKNTKRISIVLTDSQCPGTHSRFFSVFLERFRFSSIITGSLSFAPDWFSHLAFRLAILHWFSHLAFRLLPGRLGFRLLPGEIQRFLLNDKDSPHMRAQLVIKHLFHLCNLAHASLGIQN